MRASIRLAAAAAVGLTVAGIGGVPGTVGSQAPNAAICVPDLDMRDRAGQVLLVLVDDPADAEPALTDLHVAGLAPFGTVDDGELGRLAALIAADVAPLGTLVASDEEGGQVQRFDDQFGALPSAARQAAEMTPAEVEDMYAEYGAALRGAGVTVAFAPVVDVGDGPAIGNRSYGDDPAVVSRYAAAAIDGYRRAGILPVLKHFPGHGRASADTHEGAATTPPLADLRSTDLVPYADVLPGRADDVAVMVGHLVVPDLTDGEPASLSSAAITGLLREELGFDGLVVSDALGMGAITTVVAQPDAVVRFLGAGGDLALVDLADAEASRDAVVAAVADGALAEERLNEAVDHVLGAKGVGVGCETDTPPAASTAPTGSAVSLPAASGSAMSAWAVLGFDGMVGAIQAVAAIRATS